MLPKSSKISWSSRKTSLFLVGEEWRLSLHKHTGCRCGGVWLDSVPPTLILSPDYITLIDANFIQVSSEAVFILPEDVREARTSNWHYWSHLTLVEDASCPGTLDLGVNNTRRALRYTMTKAASFYSSARPKQDLSTVTAGFNLGTVLPTIPTN